MVALQCSFRDNRAYLSQVCHAPSRTAADTSAENDNGYFLLIPGLT